MKDGLMAAAVQLAPDPAPLTPDTIAGNIERAVAVARRCHAETGAELLVLPESCTTGFDPGVGGDELWDLVDDGDGGWLDPFRELARDTGATVVFGSYDRAPDRPRGHVTNTAFYLDPDGSTAGTYRKTHLYVAERLEAGGWAVPGDEAEPADTPAGRLGCVICFDGDYPELARIQAVRGAEIIVRPSAFMRPADIWELTTRARAYDNHVYVVATNAVGTDPGGLHYFGNSLIVGPTAHVLARATAQEGWTAARLDADPMRSMAPGASHAQAFDHLEDRNLALYERYGDDLRAAAKSAFPRSEWSPSR